MVYRSSKHVVSTCVDHHFDKDFRINIPDLAEILAVRKVFRNVRVILAEYLAETQRIPANKKAVSA